MNKFILCLCFFSSLGLGVRVFANGPGDLGSIPGRVIPKTQKMVLEGSLLSTQHYKVRIKGKVEQSRKGVAPSPTHWCSSYRKGSLRVTLDYGRQLYFYLYIYIYIYIYRQLIFVKELIYLISAKYSRYFCIYVCRFSHISSLSIPIRIFRLIFFYFLFFQFPPQGLQITLCSHRNGMMSLLENLSPTTKMEAGGWTSGVSCILKGMQINIPFQ